MKVLSIQYIKECFLLH